MRAHQMLLASYGAKPKVLSYIGATMQGNGTSKTYTAAAIGTPSADRCVIVAVAGLDNVTNPITGVTCAGNAMSLVKENTNNRTDCSIWIILDTTNTTADITTTFPVSKDAQMIVVWTATGLTSATAVSTAEQDTNNTSTALTTVAGGFAVSISGTYGAATSCTWTGLTEVTDQTSSTRTASAASDATAASSINITGNMASAGTAFAMAAASW